MELSDRSLTTAFAFLKNAAIGKTKTLWKMGLSKSHPLLTLLKAQVTRSFIKHRIY
jgi:hypothetical protein